MPTKKATKKAAKKRASKKIARKKLNENALVKQRLLTDFERRFVAQYIVLMNPVATLYAIDENARTQSAAAVRQRASRIIKDPVIQAEIHAQLELVAAQCNITKERITGMLLEIYSISFREGDMRTSREVANDLAKLHGLLEEKTRITVRIEDMNESQLLEFLGKRYDKKLVRDMAVDGELV